MTKVVLLLVFTLKLLSVYLCVKSFILFVVSNSLAVKHQLFYNIVSELYDLVVVVS